MRTLRIALGPVEVAGFYAQLARGLTERGVACVGLPLVPHAFQYASEPPKSAVARAALAGARRFFPNEERVGLARIAARVSNIACRAVVLAHAATSYDVVVLASGEPLLHRRELPLLRMLGKKIVVIYLGSDSRPPYMNGKGVRRARILAPTSTGRHLVEEARRIARNVAWADRWATTIIDSPLCGHFHSRAFISFFRVGFPFAPPRTTAPLSQSGGATLRVLHAPSDPATKGSALIADAVARAQRRGLRLEYTEIKGRPNHEVLDAIARSDFIIDELYSDVPGGALAIEAAALGKPSIVAGYAADELARWIPAASTLPTHYCHPDALDDAIDKLAHDSAYRVSLGARAQAFIREVYAPTAVAGRFLHAIGEGGEGGERADIEGDDIEEWLVEPADVRYVHGTGLPESVAREAVRAVLDEAGDEGLHVSSDELIARLKAFAGAVTIQETR